MISACVPMIAILFVLVFSEALSSLLRWLHERKVRDEEHPWA